MARKVFRDPKIRVPRKIAQGEIIEVRVKVQHNSYTGLKVVDGKYVADQPAYYLRQMDVFYGEELVSRYEMTSATSPNPLVRFKLRADKEAPLRVVMTNSEGITKEASTKVKFA